MTGTEAPAGTAVPQLFLPGQAAAPGGAVDVAAMYLMHRAFRRDAAAFVEVVPTVAGDDRAAWTRIARRFEFFAAVLHKHHSGEDAALWPLLAERGADAAVLSALADDHAGITLLLAAVRRDLRVLSAGGGAPGIQDRLGRSTTQLRDALEAHLGREERQGMALVQRHLTQRDWNRLGEEVFSKDYSAREIPAVLGWVTSGLPAEAIRRVPRGGNPLLRLFGRWMAGRFDRREARVFGTGPKSSGGRSRSSVATP